jgi:hypothetical protein
MMSAISSASFLPIVEQAAATAATGVSANTDAVKAMAALLHPCWDYDLILYENPRPVQHSPSRHDIELLQFYYELHREPSPEGKEEPWLRVTAHLSDEYRDSLARRGQQLCGLTPYVPYSDVWCRIVYGVPDDEYYAKQEIHAEWKATEDAYQAEGERLAPAFKQLPLDTQVSLLRYCHNKTGANSLLSLLTEEEYEELYGRMDGTRDYDSE